MDFALKVVRLDDAPVFKAVSYEWGPKDKGYQIQVDGYLKHVRKNLVTFLLMLRDHDPNVYNYWLWIDQICIDQGILDERSQQAAQMGRIYSQAEEVLVWLGSSDANDDEAIKSMMDDGRASYLFSGSKSASLFEKPYWRRLWIVQEVLLAKQLVILCGAHRIELDVLQKFVDRSKWIVPAKWTVPSLLTKRDGATTSMDLRTALSTFIRHECLDPRDKVYGISGLLEPGQRIPIDYTKKNMQVFTDILNVLLEVHFETTSGAPFVNYKRSYTLFDGYSPEALMYDGPVDLIIMAAWFIAGFELRYTAWQMNALVKEKERTRELFTVDEVSSFDAKPSSSWKRLAYLLK